MGDLGSILGLGSSPGEGNGNPLQYSHLENPMDRWAWQITVHRTARSNQSILKKSVLNIHWKDWCWSWSSNTWATWCEELTHWKRPWCWERLKAGGEGDDRGWDGLMASLTRWAWVWASSRSWWWTGKPGVLQSMGLQIVGHDWVTELNWPSSPQLLATAILLYEFDYSKYPYKWNYTAFVFLWLAYFTLQRVLRVHPCCSIYQNFLHF